MEGPIRTFRDHGGQYFPKVLDEICETRNIRKEVITTYTTQKNCVSQR